MTIEFPLSSPPSDGISCISFSPTDPNLLASTSWDKSLKIFNTATDSVAAQSALNNASLLACAWSKDGTAVYSGGLNCELSAFQVEHSTSQILGRHEAAISCVSATAFNIISGSWDKSVRIWDTRSLESDPVTLNLDSKVFSLDAVGNTLVVALANRQIKVYDLRKLDEPTQTRDSSLKFMTRSVRCIPLETGYATASIEGRVAVDCFDPAQAQSQKFSFKCHRKKEGDSETIYPVNAIAYHPIYQQTFATGGGDGVVNIWDGIQKKRLRHFPNYATSISSLSFNCTGTLLAIAASYTFEEGEKDHAPDAILIREIADAEVQPKSKAK